MDRAESTGLAVATLGHVLLFGALSLGFVSTARLPPLQSDPLDVTLVDAVGLRSAAPEATVEPPAPAEAPEIAPPEEAPPAEPAPAPAPAPVPKPIAPPVAPKPQPKQEAKELPDPGERRRPDRTTAPAKKQTGSRLGADFLKGIADSPQGKAQTPRAAAINAQAMAGLAAAITRQFKPCYELGSLQGTPAMSILTVLRLRYNSDGTVAVPPALVEQTGVDSSNGEYARQISEVARRAVLRCTPIRLPPDLYEGGWDDFELRFIPGQLG